MRRVLGFIKGCQIAEGVLLALAVIFAGCSFDANELKAFPVLDSSAAGGSSLDGSRTNDIPTTTAGGADGAAMIGTGGVSGAGGMGGSGIDAPGAGSEAFPVLDSSAVGGSSLDGSRTNDSPATTAGGADGAAMIGTGGVSGAGGMGGGGIDAPGTGSGGAGGSIMDGPKDISLADAAQPCTVGAVTYQPGQSFTVDCVTFTCVSGSNFTSQDVTCLDAGNVGGSGGSGGVSSQGSGGTTASGGTTGTGGTTTPDAGPDLALDLPSDPVDANSLLVGLEVYYPCQSVSGTATLPDMSGKEHHGTLSIGTGGAACSGAGYTFDPGRTGNGNALTLIKAGCGYVSMPAAIFANATDITIAFLVNVKASQPWQRVLDVGVNSGLSVNPNTGTKYMNLLPTNNPNGLVFAITNNGFTSEQKLSTTGLSAGVWTHLAVVLSSGQGRLYVNGTLAAGPSAILRPADLGNIDYAFIGKSGFPADPMFDGQVDEFRVYSRALSETEVLALSLFAGE